MKKAVTEYNGAGEMTLVTIVEKANASRSQSQSGVIFRVVPALRNGTDQTWYDASWFKRSSLTIEGNSMFKDDVKLPLKDLPDDADLTSSEWSWAFASTQSTGVIRHCDDEGSVTEYELPLAVCQLVVAVRAFAKKEVQCAVKHALGISLN